MDYSAWKRVLYLIFASISACAVNLPANACESVQFFNGVDVEVHRDKIINFGALLEQGGGKRIENLNVILPDIDVFESIIIYPIENENPVSNQCQVTANGSHLCFETLSNQNIWISVRIEEQMNEDELERTITHAVSYVAETVLCSD